MKTHASDLTIAYDDVGTGAPVVLMHAFPANRRQWGPQLPALSSICRCLAPDFRGFGESDARGAGSVDDYADDIARLLDALSLERAVIGGVSLGGYVTFAFWRRHPSRVRALILSDTRARSDTERDMARRRELIALARASGPVAIADRMIEGLIGKTTRRRQPELVRSVHRMLASATVDGIVGALDAMMHRPDATGDLATIAVPTLIIVGDEDVATPIRDAEIMHAGIPRSRLAIIPGAGHLSNVERPAAFNALVSEFLSTLPAP